MSEIARWAEEQYLLLSAKQHAYSTEMVELQKAGVKQWRIDALYPFSTAKYAPKILTGLQDLSKRKAIARALRTVNMPYNLSTQLPTPFQEELFAYLSQAPFTNPDGSTSPSLRVGRYSKELAQFVEANEGAIDYAETMLQPPHFLHLLRQRPFENDHWGKEEQGWWTENFVDAKPGI